MQWICPLCNVSLGMVCTHGVVKVTGSQSSGVGTVVATGPQCILEHGTTVHFFVDENPLFALILEPTNQPLHNNYVIIVYGIVRYIE